MKSSPRTWGCFQDAIFMGMLEEVFPTHVGVFPTVGRRLDDRPGLPHARGGVSKTRFSRGCWRKSSPRTWGCFSREQTPVAAGRVFPTHVGVFLVLYAILSTSRGLPHARGGVSSVDLISGAGPMSSPRTWGCFYLKIADYQDVCVFPTHVGVFLKFREFNKSRWGLPHARGGVSINGVLADPGLRSSPRTWGCFSATSIVGSVSVVFPTHVGVFPGRRRAERTRAGLPHARGGVSDDGGTAEPDPLSSPRTWGCFRPPSEHVDVGLVFPTHVEVFLRGVHHARVARGLPHARGGVSEHTYTSMAGT